MDPRIKDLAFGAALNAIVRSAGMGPTGMGTGTGSIGDQLRRIGTLPPPSSATTITTSPEEPTVQTTAPVSAGGAGGDGGYEPIPGGGAGGGGITFGNPQTPFLDRQGVPMTVADLAGRGVDILSFMSNPLSYVAGRMLTGETMGQRVKGALTPVSTATPVTSMAEIATQFAQQQGITPSQALAILEGGSYSEMTGESPGVGGAGVTGVTGVTEGFGTPSSVADVSGAQAPY